MATNYCRNANLPDIKDDNYNPVICRINNRRCVADSCVADLFPERITEHITAMTHEYNPRVAERCPCYKEQFSIKTIKNSGLLKALRSLGLLINRG